MAEDAVINASVDLGNTDQQLAKLAQLFDKQTSSIDKFLASADRLATDQLTLINNLNALTAAMQANVTAQSESIQVDDKRSESIRRQLRERQKLLDSELSLRKLGAVPAATSSFEQSQINDARQSVIRQLASNDFRSTPGGSAAALKLATDQALSGTADTTTAVGRLAGQIAILINAYGEAGNAAAASAEKQRLAAERTAKTTKAESDRIAKKTKNDAERAARDAKNASDAQGLDSILRGQFPVPSGVGSTDAARVEIPILRLTQAAAAGKINIDAVLNSLQNVAATGQLGFEGLDAKTTVWLRSLLLANKALGDLTSNPSRTLAERIASATAVVNQFQQAFTGGSNKSATALDLLITKLGILTRESGVTEDRVRQLFDATTIGPRATGLGTGVPGLAGDLSKQEIQIVSLIQRIQQLNQTAQGGAQTSAQKQAEFNARIAAAQPIIQQITNQLTTQFGQLSKPQQFLALQNQLNSIFKSIGDGKTNAQQLLDIFNRLGGGGGGKPPTTFLPPGAGGEEQSQLLRLISLFDQTGKTGTNAAKSIFLGWQNVIRIFQVQILHQILGQFIADIRASTDAATQFQIRISEIRTLSQENQLTTFAWASGLRELSDSFGLPVLDVVKAAYDAISNQVTRGAQTFEFLRTTLEFARITVSSATDAQNLLSSAIKSYGEQNLTAGKAAEVLFKIIDLGRVTASELSNTFGRVAQLSAQAGISIEELGASIATLTVRGVRYSEAYTLVNNVILKLIKPTDEMQKLFKTWGVTTGEAAIQTFGFVGVLRKLQQEFDTGGVSRLGELERDIRAIRGALGLVSGDAFADFEKNLKNISLGAEQFARAGDLIRESPGRQLEIELNKIKNILAVDFGQQFVKSVLDLTKPFGGLSNIVKIVIDLFVNLTNTVNAIIQPLATLTGAVLGLFPGGTINAIKTATNAFVAYYTATLIAGPATTALTLATSFLRTGLDGLIFSSVKATAATEAQTVATKGLAATQGLITAGLSAVIFGYIESRNAAIAFVASLEKEIETSKRLRDELEQQRIERKQQADIDKFNEKNDASFRKLNTALAENSKGINKFLDGFQDINNVKLDPILTEANKVFEFLDAKQSTVEGFAKSIADGIERSKKRISEVSGRDQTKDFTQSIAGLPDTKQFAEVIAAVRRVRSEIKTVDDVRFDNIIKISQAFAAIGGNVLNLASTLNVLSTQKIAAFSPEQLESARQSYDEINKLLTKYIEQVENAVKAQQKLIADLGVKAETKAFDRSLVGKSTAEQSALTLQRVNQLRAQAFSLFNNGELEESRKKFDEIDKLLEKIFDRQKSFREKAEKLGVKFSTPLVGGAIDSRINQNDQDRLGLERGRLSQLQKQDADLRSQQRGVVKELIELEKQYQTQQLTRLKSATDAQNKLNETQKIQLELANVNRNLQNENAKALQSRKEAESSINAISKQISDDLTERQKGTVSSIDQTINRIVGADASKNARDRIEELQKSLQEVKKDTTDANTAVFIANLTKLKSELIGATNQQNLSNSEQKTALEGINQFYDRQIVRLREILEAKRKLVEAEQNIKSAQEAQNQVTNRIGPLDNATNQSVQQLTTFNERLNTQLETFGTLMDRLNATLSKVNGGGGLAPVIPGFALGGQVPSDNKLVAMSGSEFIVNSESSRRFAPQLRAMNMGFEPKFNSTGSNNSVNVGDVHVTVTGGKNSEATADEIGNALRRKIRMGTFNFKR